MAMIKKALIGLGILKGRPQDINQTDHLLLLNLINEKLGILIDLERGKRKLKPLKIAQRESDEQWARRVLANG